MRLEKFLLWFVAILAGLYGLVAWVDCQTTAQGVVVIGGLFLILPICSGDAKIQNWIIDIDEEKERYQS